MLFKKKFKKKQRIIINHKHYQDYKYIIEFYMSQIFYDRIVLQLKLRILGSFNWMDFDGILSPKVKH